MLMRHSLILTTLLLLAACVPYSDTPLSEPQAEPMDTALFGTWFWNEGSETGYLHIGLDESSKLLRVLMVDFDREGDLDESEFMGHTSTVGGNHYLNLKWVRPLQEDIPGHILVKYVAKPDSLGIGLMDADVPEAAIEQNRLEGEIVGQDWSRAIHITARQEALRAYVQENDAALFPEIKTLGRLRLPPPAPDPGASTSRSQPPPESK